MSKKDVLITTTSVDDLIQIHHYKGIVSARVVTGVDIFSDIFASFSDVFGGRSATYQKQLKSIYEEVMHQLTEEAVKLGANAIVGVKIDHDEVSGKGKQMFMVTAIGTAAYIPVYDQEKKVEDPELIGEISLDKYQYEHRRLNMIYDVNEDYNVIPNCWPAILEYYSPEIMGQVFKHYCVNNIDYNNTFGNVYQYFTGVDELLAKKFLYEKLQINDKAMIIIDQAKLTDYDHLENIFLNDSKWNVKKNALVLVSGDKRRYHTSDIGRLEKLIGVITTTFVQRAKHEADKWICECGKVNKSSITYCKSCDHDDKGFMKGEVSVEDTLEKLKKKLYVLKHVFGQS